MPTIESTGARVLVTGANGYIDMFIIRSLLQKGHAVRGTIRSLDKGKRLKECFSSYGDELELFVVNDIEKDGAFDEAVKGVDAIIHTASLTSLHGVDPDEYIKPAIQGTLNILTSALQYGDRVKRVVLTSSVGAIYNTVKAGTFTLDETSWADEAVEYVKEKGKQAEPMVKYCASKVLSEKAAWDFVHHHDDEISWDLVVLHPSFVFGPTLQAAKSPKDLNQSLRIFWDIIAKDMSDEELKATYAFVDVRDVATAHVKALRREKAGGERIIIANGSFTAQAFRDLVHALQPELFTFDILPRGNPNLDHAVQFKYNAAKSKRILDLEYTSAVWMVSDILADFEARGWLEKRADI